MILMEGSVASEAVHGARRNILWRNCCAGLRLKHAVQFVQALYYKLYYKVLGSGTLSGPVVYTASTQRIHRVLTCALL
jgi:hypothetical protein